MYFFPRALSSEYGLNCQQYILSLGVVKETLYVRGVKAWICGWGIPLMLRDTLRQGEKECVSRAGSPHVTLSGTNRSRTESS